MSINSTILDVLLSHGAPRLRGLSSNFKTARPFPHIVVDGLLPAWLLNEIDHEFPDESASACPSMGHRRGWHCTMHAPTVGGWKKLGTGDEMRMGSASRGVMQALKSAAFRQHIENLTGVGPLEPDPMNSGAGLHQIFPNGSLQLHADNNHMHNRDPASLDPNGPGCTKHYCAERRVNAFLYLNRE